MSIEPFARLVRTKDDAHQAVKDAERWLPIAGWEDVYSVSDLGRVRSERRIVDRAGGRHSVRERVLKPGIHTNGYLTVVLSREGRPAHYYVHRLVLEAFRGPCPCGMEARHLDGSKANAPLTNLEWGTPIENAADRERHGTQPRGEAASYSKLTAEEVRAIRGDPRMQRRIALAYGVSQTSISRIKLRKTWSSV